MAKFITIAVLWFVVALIVWWTSKGGESLWDVSRLGQLGDAMAPATLLAVAWSLKLAVDERREAQKDRDAANREREAAVEKGEEQLGAVLALVRAQQAAMRAQQDAVELDLLREMLGEMESTGASLERQRSAYLYPGASGGERFHLVLRSMGTNAEGKPNLIASAESAIGSLAEACRELESARILLTEETDDTRRARRGRMAGELTDRLRAARELLAQLVELRQKYDR